MGKDAPPTTARRFSITLRRIFRSARDEIARRLAAVVGEAQAAAK